MLRWPSVLVGRTPEWLRLASKRRGELAGFGEGVESKGRFADRRDRASVRFGLYFLTPSSLRASLESFGGLVSPPSRPQERSLKSLKESVSKSFTKKVSRHQAVTANFRPFDSRFRPFDSRFRPLNSQKRPFDSLLHQIVHRALLGIPKRPLASWNRPFYSRMENTSAIVWVLSESKGRIGVGCDEGT